MTRDRRELPQNLKLPLILKVPMEGSTFGIVKVERAEEWDAALEKEFAMAGELLVEEYIDGIEITVPIVNGEVLPAIEIKSPHGFYDYDAKYVYKDGHTEYFCPAAPSPRNRSPTPPGRRSSSIWARAAATSCGWISSSAKTACPICWRETPSPAAPPPVLCRKRLKFPASPLRR